MFCDGFYISGMTLVLKRDGIDALPQEMREVPVAVELSSVQMKAIAAILGLGYRDGELLYYKDEDIIKKIVKEEGKGVADDFKMLDSEERNRRNAHRINVPFAESTAKNKIKAIQDEYGVFDFDVKSDV